MMMFMTMMIIFMMTIIIDYSYDGHDDKEVKKFI